MASKPPCQLSPSRPGRGPLYTAAEKGRIRLVSLLVTLGQNVDKSDSYGITPLQIAAWNNHCEVVQKLCRHSQDVDVTDKTGHTALFKAVWNGCTGCVENLVNAGAKCDVADVYGNTPLMLAAELAYVQVTGRLLKAGAPFDHQNWRGETALYMAAASCHVPCLRLLLQLGADPNLADVNGCTPLFCCVSSNSSPSALISIVLLLRANADPENKGRTLDVSQGRPLTPFDLALHLRRYRAARILALAGCDVTTFRRWVATDCIPKALQEETVICDFLTDISQRPPQLKHSCRRVIRKHCKTDSPSIFLPKPLLDFLNYNELDQEIGA